MEQWIDALRRILENPAQNASAIATGVAIIVLSVIVIALILIAFALPGREADSDNLAGLVTTTKRGWPRWLSWAVGSAIALAGLAGATALWYVGTSGNAYCTSTCHAMAEATESWSLSAHSSVACVRCHEGPRWQSLPRGLANRTLCLYFELANKPGRSMTVPASNCMGCHRNVIRKPLVARNGETFLHGEALTQDRRCTRCHGAQGHELGRP